MFQQGQVVVSYVSKPIDSRLNRGVIVLGVNDVILPIGGNAQQILEGLLEESEGKTPFSITFCAEEHDIEKDGENYEEESFEDHSMDDEMHSGSFEVTTDMENYADALKQRNQEQKEYEDNVPLADAAATLLKTSVMSMSTSIASKYRTLRGKSDHVDENAQKHDENEYDDNSEDGLEEDNEEKILLTDNMFDLLLPGRSPPFVFDLHADGSSIVVVKLVGTKSAMDPRLREGCVVRGVNGRPVLCKSRQDFDEILAGVDEFPLRMTLEHAPSLYRHQDALALYTEASNEPAIHMYTVLPYKVGPQEQDVEGVIDTARRAKDVLQAFRAQGIAVSLVSIETVLIRENASAYSGLLSTQPSSQSYSSYITSSLSQQVPLLRAIRVWFRFQESLDIYVTNPTNDLGLLEVTKNGADGGWIVIRCIGQSSWLDAGMVLGRPYLLTHVDGYDTSSVGYRSIEPRLDGIGTWDHSVLPYIHDADEVKFTLV